MEHPKISIAIDGPAGAGKSSVSKEVAKKLHYLYIDTGAMYRAVTWAVLDAGVDPSNQAAVEALLPELQLIMKPVDDTFRIEVKGVDITPLIRTQEINDTVSTVASYKGVRQYLVERQRFMARSGGVILDGRDIGSIVLPQAELKIYLTASVETRATRRWIEVHAVDQSVSLETIKESVEKRDYMDKHRDESPLMCVDDAIVVDSSHLSFDETVKRILSLVQERIKDE
ncbi:cytidylate kinase [Veillonella montpellierensis DNF00314]|uniref:Cytidylate kinase n=1 Tax=Veillonella montpellierensis DNF00314 TaxID=1401067 RepID=A0A096AK50_9FIRM|nr:(d)CMP kinase [Veillonella montpellierensis]KGF47478.1 cytidylate kinase [Veillonella montpellierensis DNF00314]